MYMVFYQYKKGDNMQKGINVYSEIGKLKKVLLKKPGEEVENLTPDLMERLLFDDIPYLKIAREEHDAFANILRGLDVEVVYLENMVAEVLADDTLKKQFIDEFISETRIIGSGTKDSVRDYFLNYTDTQAMVDKMVAGLKKTEISQLKKASLSDMISTDYPFIIDPMPNLYFTRDPFATMGKGVTINNMRTTTRRRETLLGKYILQYHPDFAGVDVPLYYDRTDKYCVEGGDELIISDKVIAIGVSQRTDAAAIELIAERVLSSDESFETILAFEIPSKRAFMHLDTVFTMVDHNKFTIHPEIEGPLNVYAITMKDGKLNYEKQVGTIEEILVKYIEADTVEVIRCGGGDIIAAAREQWNDGSNTLAVAPGEVIVYSRNYVTNEKLQQHGITTHIMPSSELSRGRGGPRCMSMPLIRL